MLNLGKPVKIPELNETQAIELGANLLGETIIYSIGKCFVLTIRFPQQILDRLNVCFYLTGAGLLIFEYKRYA